MKKILFGITSLTLGGAERVLVDLANALCDKYEITILAIKNGDKINVIPSPEEQLQENSILVVIGNNSNISAIVTKDKNSK